MSIRSVVPESVGKQWTRVYCQDCERFLSRQVVLTARAGETYLASKKARTEMATYCPDCDEVDEVP